MGLTLDGVNGISATGNIVSSTGYISATGNIYAGNLIATIASSTVSVIGNITGGNIIATNNILTPGIMSSTGAAIHSSLTLGTALTAANGGTGITSPGDSGNVLTSNGSAWASAAGPIPGIFSQIFTSTGTFTIPTGTTAIKVTVVGGSGGVNYAYNNAGAGGTTSFGSYLSATGGGPTYGICCGLSYGGGGYGYGPTFNFLGPSGGQGLQANAVGLRFYYGYYGTPNPTGSGYYTGGYGGAAISWITGLTPGATVAVTIGAAGSGGTPYGSYYNSGAAGYCLVEW